MSTDTPAAGQKAAEHVLHRLQRITSSQELDFTQRVDAILHLGADHFGLPIGIFSKIDGEIYDVVQAIHPENEVKAGMRFDLGETYCCYVVAADDVCGFHHVAESEIKTHPCYKSFALEAYLGAPIMVDGVRFGTLNFSSPSPTRPFSGQDIEIVRLFASWVGHEIARGRDLSALETSRKQVEDLTTTDPLTGLYNRRYMQECLTKELERAKRYDNSFVIGLLDFDNFKDLNAKYGPQTGDAALRLFGKVSSEMMRETDIISRWGAEEFLILMPETTAEGALRYLQRLTDKVRDTAFHAQDDRLELTLSVGLGVPEEGDTSDSLVSRANIAMYEAKNTGPNMTKPQRDIS
ncbi:diguanylate cyclase [Thalassospira lucentensis]|uniref:sensor domain-containing diguanylate cyclase n=1 Tax=Thalassospira lucentensis TaxID=168935 RepID=UPI003AA7C455